MIFILYTQVMGTTEIIVIAIVLIILFGGKKLPELAKGLGESIKEFRNAFSAPPEKSKQKDQD